MPLCFKILGDNRVVNLHSQSLLFCFRSLDPVASMAAMDKFVKFLNSNDIPPAVQAFMLRAQTEGGLGWKAISDFAGYFADKDYEDGVQEVVLNSTLHKEDKTARSRLRVAWRLARAELTKPEDSVKGAVEEMDWDAPLGEDDEKKRADDVASRYDGLKLLSGSMPAANVIARYYREFGAPKKQAAIPALKRMRSAAENPCEPSVKRQKLAENTELLQKGFRDVPDKYFYTAEAIFRGSVAMETQQRVRGRSAHAHDGRQHRLEYYT